MTNHLIHVRLAIIRKQEVTTTGEYVEKREADTLWEHLITSVIKSTTQVPQKIKNSYRSNQQSHFWVYLKEVKSLS